MKYSLFLLEKTFHDASKYAREFTSPLTKSCFEYIKTFHNLEDAKSAQKEFKNKTLILASW